MSAASAMHFIPDVCFAATLTQFWQIFFRFTRCFAINDIFRRRRRRGWVNANAPLCDDVIRVRY
jgi:hypothetical protein